MGEGNLTAEILEEAHLKAFKAIDAPLAPSSRGASLFAGGMDDASRQTFRDRLLDCTVEQMRACAEKSLRPDAGAGHRRRARERRSDARSRVRHPRRAGERHLRFFIFFFVKEQSTYQ